MFKGSNRSYLKLPVGGENAYPAVIIVSHYDVSTHIYSYTCRPLQLPRGAATHPKPQLELPIISEHLHRKKCTEKLAAAVNMYTLHT